MTDTQPMQAMSTDKGGANDGVETPSGKGDGESNGGAYPNPHTGKGPQDDVGGGFMGHGGQSGMGYAGSDGDEANDDAGRENAVTR